VVEAAAVVRILWESLLFVRFGVSSYLMRRSPFGRDLVVFIRGSNLGHSLENDRVVAEANSNILFESAKDRWAALL
jgi:hypothetical protein